MFDIEVVRNKKEKLLEIGELLKKDFIGLDQIIDRIISSMEVWYTFPELLTHPLIINLWGMTGVGKTDLIRKLVNKLSFRENYLEIQLTSSADKYETVQSKLTGLNITSDKQAILLLDEIQRFSTINEKDEVIRGNGFNDIWELLSDGSFSNALQERYELKMFLYELLYNKDSQENSEEDDDLKEESEESASETPKEEKKKKKFKNYIWFSNKFKMITETHLSVEEIMQLSIDDQISIINNKLDALDKTQTNKKYKNLLIFICGNIDEAYFMSKDVSEVDIDADVLYEKTNKISLLNIKQSLLKKFKPEQIARLGNNHIIYSSLSKKNFKELISNCLSAISIKFQKISNVSILFAPDVYEVIYQNGVFPTQGVRPVFSTINNLIENSLPEFLLKALTDKTDYISLSFDVLESCIVCEYVLNGKSVKHTKKVQLDIARLKRDISKESLSLIATHEIGHVVAYIILFNTVPVQVCSDAVNFANGFVIPHQIIGSKEQHLNMIQLYLGGKVAEEIVFGDLNTVSGSQSDIAVATRLACEMVRAFNMDGYVGKILPITVESGAVTLNNVHDTNVIIEQILKDQKIKVTGLIQKNSKLFKVLVQELLKHKKLLAEDLFNIAKDFVPDLQRIELKEELRYNYSDALNKFLK